MKRTIVCLLVAAGLYETTNAQGPAARELSAAWSLAGPWTGVVGDENSGTIYTLGFDRVAEVNASGQILQEIRLQPGSGRTMRLGRFPATTLVTFSRWGPGGVTADDLSGQRLWTYSGAPGVDDVWVGDLDGDESDEVVVGYNGGGGAHVLDSHGQLRWKSTGIVNVWQVTVGDVLGRGRAQVVTTSARGRVHVFNGDGEDRLDIAAPGVYASVVRVQKLRPQDRTATILVAGNLPDRKGSTVMALAADGAAKWKLGLPSVLQTASVASSRPWLALGGYDTKVFVVDAIRGETLGVAAMWQGATTEVGWASDPPLLLVATGRSLNAFRVAER